MSPNPSPVPVPATAARRVATVVSRLLVAATVAGVALAWSDVPDRVPYHFDLSGEPDRWGGRGWLTALPVLQVLLALFLEGMRRALPRLAAWQGAAASRPARLRLGAELLALCEVVVVATLALGSWEQIAVARGQPSPVGGALVPGMLAALAVVLTVELLRMRRAELAEAAGGAGPR